MHGNNHIQNFHLGRYIVGYTFGNHVLRLRSRVAVKLNFRPHIRRYTSPNENFEYSYPLIGLLKHNTGITQTLCLLLSSASNLCKQFGLRSGRTKCWACSWFKLFDTLMVFLRDIGLKKSTDEKKAYTVIHHTELKQQIRCLYKWVVWVLPLCAQHYHWRN